MAGLMGYQKLQYWHGASARLQNVTYHREMEWYELLKIGSR